MPVRSRRSASDPVRTIRRGPTRRGRGASRDGRPPFHPARSCGPPSFAETRQTPSAGLGVAFRGSSRPAGGFVVTVNVSHRLVSLVGVGRIVVVDPRGGARMQVPSAGPQPIPPADREGMALPGAVRREPDRDGLNRQPPHRAGGAKCCAVLLGELGTSGPLRLAAALVVGAKSCRCAEVDRCCHRASLAASRSLSRSRSVPLSARACSDVEEWSPFQFISNPKRIADCATLVVRLARPHGNFSPSSRSPRRLRWS